MYIVFPLKPSHILMLTHIFPYLSNILLYLPISFYGFSTVFLWFSGGFLWLKWWLTFPPTCFPVPPMTCEAWRPSSPQRRQRRRRRCGPCAAGWTWRRPWRKPTGGQRPTGGKKSMGKIYPWEFMGRFHYYMDKSLLPSLLSMISSI